MRLAQVGTVALALMSGCVRFGYDLLPAPEKEAGGAHGGDNAAHGGGGAAAGHRADDSRGDASVVDAFVSDSSSDNSDAADSAGAGSAGASGAAGDTSGTAGGAGRSGAGGMEEPLDAGQSDAGSSDAAADDGAVKDLCPERDDALFCDGFEGSSLSPWDYTVVINGSVSHSTTLFHGGASSLRATTGAAGTNNEARYGVRAFPHQKSGDIWVRYYYYLPSSTVIDTMFSTGVVSEIEEPYFGFSLVVRPASVDIGVLGTMYPGNMAFPRDRWACVELHVQIDPINGTFEAYIDGTNAARTTALNTLPAMGYTSVDMGIHYTDPQQGPVEAYVDDVVAGNTRVGCD